MATSTIEFEQVMKQLHDLREAVQNNAVTTDKAENIIREIVRKQLTDMAPRLPYSDVSQSVYVEKGLDPEAQQYGDYVLLAKAAIEAQQGRKCDVPRLKRNMVALGLVKDSTVSKVEKAMGTGETGYGLEWIPTQFSPQLIDRVRLELKVAALHGRVPMPTNPYKAPVVAADASAYLSPENVSDTKTYLTPSKAGTTNITFTAKKLTCRIIVSDELTEDSIVPILPFIQNQAVGALAAAQEDATINGDTAIGTASAIDYDMQQSDDANNPRAAWNGYRKLVNADSTVKVDLGTFNISNLRLLRQKMGKYGVNPGQLAWVVSVAAYNKMLSLPEVMTLDKYGPQATLLQGELGRLDNIPIIVSEYVRQDLDATGVNSSTPGNNIKTIALLVFRPGFMYGDRRQVTVRSKEDWETEQTIIASSQRLDFEVIFSLTTEKMIGLGYNIALT